MNQHAHPYNVIVGKHLHVTDAMRDYVTKKLHKVERLSDSITDIHVTLDVQKIQNNVTIVMHFGHYTIKSQASSDDMYASIDKAVNKLSSLLQRYKERIQAHHNTSHAEVNMNVDVYLAPSEIDIINEEIDEENRKRDVKKYELHKIMRKEQKPLKVLTRDEAIIKMELSSEPFMIFKSEEDQKIKVIYRMTDDNYGIIEPL